MVVSPPNFVVFTEQSVKASDFNSQSSRDQGDFEPRTWSEDETYSTSHRDRGEVWSITRPCASVVPVGSGGGRRRIETATGR